MLAYLVIMDRDSGVVSRQYEVGTNIGHGFACFEPGQATFIAGQQGKFVLRRVLVK